MHEKEKLVSEINKSYTEILETFCKIEYLRISDLGLKIEEEDKNLIENSEEVLDAYYNKKQNIKEIDEHCFLETKIFKLLIYEHIHLFTILADSFVHSSPNINLSKRNSQKFIHLTTFLNNQINNLKSALLLLEHGLTQSSEIIFRNYIETSEKALAILINENFFDSYRKETTNETEEKNIWNKTKPYKAFNIIKTHFLKLNELKEFYEVFFDIRQSIYSQTSKAVHSQLSSTIKESLNSNNKDFLQWSISGNKNQKSKTIFKEYILYIKTFLKSLMIIMVKDYKISFNKFGNDGLYQIYIHQVTEKSFKYYLERIEKL